MLEMSEHSLMDCLSFQSGRCTEHHSTTPVLAVAFEIHLADTFSRLVVHVRIETLKGGSSCPLS